MVANGMNCQFDNDVIARVEELAMEEDAYLIADGYPYFEWAPGVPIIYGFEVPVAHEQAIDKNNNMTLTKRRKIAMKI